MTILLFLAVQPLHAADPWDRPEHARLVEEPPEDWEQLQLELVRHRIWWDDGPQPAEIQIRTRRGWRQASEGARPGWTSPPLPRGAVFRLRFPGGQRWRTVQAGEVWVGPAEWAAMAGPGTAVHADVIGELQTGRHIWASTLGGGLSQLEPSGDLVDVWTRWDGLPSPEVIALDVDGERVLVGTARGAALIEEGKLVRIWHEELPDPYVQAVAIDGERLWIGSFRGLALWEEGELETVLEPWSVFSLSPDDEGGIWIGYEGLSKIGADGVLQTVEWPGNVYDIVDNGVTQVLASETRGVLLAEDGKSEVLLDLEAVNLARGLHGIWIAAGEEGLVGPNGTSYGKAQGLPSDTVWSAAQHAGDLWVGAEGGLVRLRLDGQGNVEQATQASHSPWPAGREAWEVLPSGSGAFFSGPEGVWFLGEPHPQAGSLAIAAPSPTLALGTAGGDHWAVGRDEAISLDGSGGLRRIEFPEKALSATLWLDRIWFATENALWWADPATGKSIRAENIGGLGRLRGDEYYLWGIDARGVAVRIHPSGKVSHFPQAGYASDVSPSGKTACLGTGNGLVRIWPDRKNPVEDVLGSDDEGVAVTAVHGDGEGGCWFAGEDGTVALIPADRDEWGPWIKMPQEDLPRPLRILPWQDSAWLLTEKGVWLLDLPQ
jgi:hypothetical protein